MRHDKLTLSFTSFLVALLFKSNGVFKYYRLMGVIICQFITSNEFNLQ